MLRDFFRLNVPFHKWDENQLANHFRTSTDIQNVLYEPPDWPVSLKWVVNSTFKNVSFSKTTISQVTFRDCIFEDCLFIGATLVDVRFHQCQFQNCNFYRVELIDCYLDPRSISFDRGYKKTAANVGVEFFQKLLENSVNVRQPFFEIDADIRFRQWKRAQLWYDFSQDKIGRLEFTSNYIRSGLYELLCGFGYRPLRFVIWTLAIFLGIAIINAYVFTDGLQVNGIAVNKPDIIDSIFYTFSILTVLGFSSIVPDASAAKILTVLEALGGVGWMGIFTSVLVKRLLK